MSALAGYAERVKLARLLRLEPAALDYLDGEDALALRGFREGLSDALFARYRKSFEGMAKLSSMLPLGANALLSEKILGATLSARIAGELPVKRAVALAQKLPVEFLASVSLNLEPKRAAAVIARIPAPRVVAVARELLAAGEYVTMARFVDSLSDEALKATLEVIDSDEALLRIGFFVESGERLSFIVRLLSDKRRLGTVRAAGDNGLWLEALGLMLNLDDDAQARIGDLIAAQDDDFLAGATDAVAAHGAWTLLARILARQDAKTQRRLAAFGAERPAGEHDELMDAADAAGLRKRLASYEKAFDQARG